MSSLGEMPTFLWTWLGLVTIHFSLAWVFLIRESLVRAPDHVQECSKGGLLWEFAPVGPSPMCSN